jgi:small subunit ribosomal protein S24e
MLVKIKVASEKHNPLLKRREVVFEVDHKQAGSTPPRLQVRKELASLLKSDLELVYVKRLETRTGTMVAVGDANAYDSVEDAKLVEPEYVIARNVPPVTPEEEERAREKPREKPEEKPKEVKVKEAAEKVEEEVKETVEKSEEKKGGESE